MRIIEFLKTRSIAYFILIASTVCGLVALLVYLFAGTNDFATSLSPEVIVPLALGFAIGVFSVFKTFKLALLGQYVVFLYGFISVFTVNITLITNLLYNVDGSSVPAAIIVIAIFAFFATFGSLTAGIMTRYGQGSNRRGKEE